VIGVLNKVDAVADVAPHREALADAVDDVVAVSAIAGDGLDSLRDRVRDALPTKTETLYLPNDGDGQATLSWLYDYASVDDVTYGDDIAVTVTARPTILERARAKAPGAT